MEVALTHGKIALIDDEDGVLIAPYKWYAINTQNDTWYAVTNMSIDNKPACVGLHRLVMGLPELTVDHIDRNTLDCRKHNLREATRSQQSANRRIFRNNKSGYRGVFFKDNRWHAIIQGKWLKGAHFLTPEEAAHAYDAEALRVFGEFAQLNFPNT